MEACASDHHWARLLRAMGPPGAADAARLCEAICKARQDQHGRSRGDDLADDAFRCCEDRGAAGGAHVAQNPRSPGPAADDDDQRASGASGRVWHCRSSGRCRREGRDRKAARLWRLASTSRPPGLTALADQVAALDGRIAELERDILMWHRSDETSQRLATIPGVGPLTASALAASMPDPSLFRSGRQFDAWLGLTPKAHSSGGKERQAGISKMGR